MQAEERRWRSEQRLAREGIQVNAAPPVRREDRVKLRSTEEALWRALCACVVGIYGDALDRATTLEEVERWELWPHFTPEEDALLWALGILDELGAWDPEQTQECCVSRSADRARPVSIIR